MNIFFKKTRRSLSMDGILTQNLLGRSSTANKCNNEIRKCLYGTMGDDGVDKRHMGGRLFTCLFAFQFEILISFSGTPSHMIL